MLALIDTEMGIASDLAMRNMFAARKEVFVDLLGWDVPVLEDRYEIDQFDDTFARYLIVSDESLNHLGSARLLPTTRPHILDTLFPELCAGPVPQGPTVFEITRFCLSRHLGAVRRREVRNRLVTALAETALAAGITTYTGVAEAGWLRQILDFGWTAAPLGQPLSNSGATLGAMRIEIDQRTEQGLRSTGIWQPTTRCVTAQPAAALGEAR